MRPQYLKDIISLSAGEAGQKALRALTKLCNFLLSGQLPSEICHLLYGASLCALNKKDGGLRPIAIGNCLRRLTSKLACFQSRNIVNSYLSPHQLGVATKLGCEAAIHTTRTFVNNDQNRGKVLLKLDFKNAFNSVERDCILKEVQCHTPLLYPYLYQCYRNPSTLFFGNHLISSSVGAQQGDPCGPMIFSLAIQPIILSLDSQMNIWYLDDGTLADYPEVVLSDFKKVINLSQEIGLELNFNKCEIFCCSGDTDLKVIKEFQNLAPGIKICDRESLSLLGSPIFDQGFKNTVEKTIITVENLLNKAELLNRHVAYTLIKNCLFIPKFNFLLRTTPFWKFSNSVNSIDSSLKSCLERILNLRLTDLQWRQSTLPIRFGGLGIRRISDICLPAFLSSINGVKKLVSLLLNSKDNELNIHHYDEALAVWGVANENEIPTIPQFDVDIMLYDVVYKASKSDHSRETRNSFRKLYREKIKLKKMNYNKKSIETAKNKTKAMWNIVNQNRNTYSNTCDETCDLTSNSFNTFFTSIASQTTSCYSNSNANTKNPMSFIREQLNPPNSTNFQFREVSCVIVRDLIDGLKNSNCNDIYDLNVNLIKTIKNVIISPLTKLVNLCIRENTFPECLK
jgi:hypothetical protein